MSLLATIIAIIIVLATLPSTLYLLLLTTAGALPARKRGKVPLLGGIAIVVPAHNEAENISRTLLSLRRASQRDGDTDIFVIADNCTDSTAEIARPYAKRVLHRADSQRRGKGYALDFAFSTLLPEDYVAFVVIDADSVVEVDFIAHLRQHFGAGEMALQTRYTVLNGEASSRTGLAEIALAAFNVLRPRSRDRLGLSTGILGNGFALRREVLSQVPYTASSIVEDLEYHLRLCEAGIRVGFVDSTSVRGTMPIGQQGADTQRTRWEGGRLHMLRSYGRKLARNILRAKFSLIEPLADLLLLPLALHLLLTLAAASLLLASLEIKAAAALTLTTTGVLFAHVLIAMRVTNLPWTQLKLLARIPAYLVWKLRLLIPTLTAAHSGAAWTRTNRTGL